jgi:hypothetical protein
VANFVLDLPSGATDRIADAHAASSVKTLTCVLLIRANHIRERSRIHYDHSFSREGHDAGRLPFREDSADREKRGADHFRYFFV